MKIIFLCSCFVVSLTVHAKEIGLKELIELAFTQNYDLKIKDNDKEISRLEKKLSFRGLYLPKATWALKATQENTKGGPFTNYTAEPDSPTFYSSEFQLSYDLFNGFKDLATHNKNQYEYEYQKEQLEFQEQSLIYSLYEKYISVSQEISKLAILDEVVDKGEKIYKAAQVQYKKGRMAKVDLNRSRLDYLDAKSNRLEQLKIIETQTISLFEAINTKRQAGIEIRPLQYLKLDKELQELINFVKNQGPQKASEDLYQDYLRYGVSDQIATLNHKKALEELNEVQSGFYPKLNFALGHVYGFDKNPSSFSTTKRDYNTIGLYLTIPLFDSFDTMIQNKQEKLNLLSKQHLLNQERIVAQASLRSLCVDLLHTYEKYLLAKEKLDLQKAIYQSTFKRFNIGAITIRDLIDDKVDLRQESFNLAELGFLLRKIHLNIQKLTGKLEKIGETI